ncbi:MAG: porin [Flavobacteriales bacterium]
MRSTVTLLLVLALFVGASAAHAQQGTTVSLEPHRGLLVKRDTTFELLFRFRMQDRVAFTHKVGDDLADASAAFLVRRFRIKFEGFALSPKLKYKVQLGLSENDQNVGDGTPPSPLLDAMVSYAITPHTSVGFGQGKLPGGRQALVSSGELELPERPLANGSFTADRDFGFFVDHSLYAGEQAVRLRAAITQGEGRSASSGDLGLNYTGRLEWLPLGAFSGKDGDYQEGDLLSEPTPKLSIATAFSTNRNARRSLGVNGPRFPNGQGRTIDTFFADMLFKHNGWSWQNEFNQRHTEGPPLLQDTLTNAITAVDEGWGITSELGRMVGKRSQAVVRYSAFMPGERVVSRFFQREEAWAGWSYYLNDHRVKLQSAVTYTWQHGVADFSQRGNQWGLFLQVEMGI